MKTLTQELESLSPEQKRDMLSRLLREKSRGQSVLPALKISRGSDQWPLTFAQRRLWLIGRQNPDNPMYNIPLAVHLRGTAFSPQTWKRSLEEVVQRHWALRSTFHREGAEVVQRISDQHEVELPMIDLSGLPVAEREAEAQRLATAESRRIIDLERGPIVRFLLFRLAADAHVGFFNVHHIAFDGWSLDVLIRELNAIYPSLAVGEASPLAALPVQYVDFAAWVHRHWEEELSSQLDYWRRQLSGIAQLQIPTDRPRSRASLGNGATHRFDLEPGLRRVMSELGQRHGGATLSMTLMAAFMALLGRISSQTDIAVGTALANRRHQETEALLGFFANTLVMRGDLSGRPSFSTVLDRVRRMSLEAYDHEDTPFERVVEALQPERGANLNPIFQVGFVLQDKLFFQGLSLPKLQCDAWDFEAGVVRLDLELHVWREGDGLSAVFIYDRDLFDATTIGRLVGHYRSLLEGVAAAPEEPLATLPLLSAGQRQQLLEWNDTGVRLPARTLHRLFEAQVESAPGAKALIFEDESWTYADVNREANRLARHLRGLEVDRGTCVGLCLERLPDLVVGMLATLKAGGVYVPLDPSYPSDRLVFMAGDAGVAVTVTRRGTLTERGGFEFVWLDLDAEAEAISARECGNLEIDTTPQDLAYIIYTSGSTGRPKGSAIPQEAVVRLLFGTNYQRVERSDRIAQAANTSFDAATYEIWGAVLNGACLVGLARSSVLDPKRFVAALRQHRVTQLFVTTSLFNRVAENVPDAFFGLRQVMFGGEAVTPSWVREILTRGSPQRLLHVYGPTETTTFASFHPITEVADKATTVPIGRPISNTELVLLDRHGQPVPAGVVGELYVGGAGLAHGYHGQPQLTAQAFMPHLRSDRPGARLYCTGDRVRFLADGTIEFLGRFDDQVKIRGFRIELDEVASSLERHPGLKQVAIVVREDVPGDKRITAYVVADGPAPEVGELRGFLNRTLPDFMVPAAFVVLDQLPLNPNGKVDRRALPKPVVGAVEVGPRAELAAPADWVSGSSEDRVRSLWCEVLGASSVGAEDDFFELGGHSLLAMGMLAEISDAYGIDLDPAVVFEHSRFDEFVAAVEDALVAADKPAPAAAALAGRGGSSASVQASSSADRLRRLWCEVLGASSVGAEDDFFELGGHSLLAMGMLAEISDAYGIDLDPAVIFEHSRFDEFVAAVEDALVAADKLPPGVPSVPVTPSVATVAGPVTEEAKGAVDPGAGIPLAFAQRRLWFIDQLQGSHRVYNIPLKFELDGHLDVSVLERVLGEVVRRHETLRTTFEEVEGRPFQRIHAPVPVALPVIDLAGDGAQRRDQQLEALETEEARQLFDLVAGPLWRFKLVQLGTDRHVLLMTIHHIVFDGWSITVFLDELAALYTCFVRDRPSPLPELPIQYAEYGRRQRELLAGATQARQLDYWRRRLAGSSNLNLPTDRPRPLVQSLDGAYALQSVSEPLVASLRRHGRSQGCTLFMTLMAAFKVLLARYSGQSDVSVGIPVANRTRFETQGLIGYFANSLVTRDTVNDGVSFDALVTTIRRSLIEAQSHQDLPFEKLIEELQPERSLSHAPLFQVMFTYYKASAEVFELPELTLRNLPHVVGSGSARFDLTLGIIDRGETLTGIIEYSTDLFDAATASRVWRHLLTLLSGAAAAPESSVGTLPLLTPSERAQIVTSWNDTRTGYAREASLVDLFESCVEGHGEQVAVTFRDKKQTYADFNRRANRLAHYLRDLGVGPEVRVGVLMDKRTELLESFLGILKAGGAYIPVDPAYPRDRIELIAADAGLALLITEDKLIAAVPELSVPSVSIDAIEAELAARPDHDPGVTISPQSLAYVIYTSGSTGRPKGVAVPHRAVVRLVDNSNFFELGPGDIFLLVGSVIFDVSTFEIWGPLVHGSRLVVAPSERLSPVEIGEMLKQTGATATFLVTPLFHQVVEQNLESLHGVKQVVTGGDAVSVAHMEKVFESLPDTRVIDGYGPSENTTFSSFCRLTPDDLLPSGSVSIGRPLANSTVYILDQHLEPTPIGVPGELFTGGDGVARGYLSRAARTAGSFLPDPFAGEPGARMYATGDLSRLLPDGRLEFLGRIDFQVKVRGFRIELGEIEAALAAHPKVQEQVVVARREPSGDKTLVAYVVPREGQELTPADLRSDLAEHLPEYMLPSAYVSLDSFPKTASGKIDRKALPTPDRDSLSTDVAYLAPRSDLEETIAGIWAKVLGVDRVGVFDSFFDLGGHSLLANELVFALGKGLGIEISLRQVFEAPTVAGLAALVGEFEATDAGVTADLSALPVVVPTPGERHEPFPLTDVQQAYWIGRGESLELGKVAAHGYLEIEVYRVDLARLTVVVRRLIDHHEMLRAIFPAADEQRILPHVPPYEVTRLDLRGATPELIDQSLAAVRAEMSHRVPDPTSWPLFEIRASLLDEERFLLHIDFDALLADAWSLFLIARQAIELYREPTTALPELELSFRDYVLAEGRFESSEVYQRSRQYWWDRLPTLPPAPELPLAVDPGALRKPRFERRHAMLARPLWSRLKDRAAGAGLTPSGLLLAAFSEVLGQWSKSSAFTLNVTTFNRRWVHPQVLDIVGDFTSLTLLAVDTAAGESFETRARHLQARLWEDLQHNYVDGVRVMRELAQRSQASPGALMPVVFSSALGQIDRHATSWQDHMVYSITQTPQVWLDHQVFEKDGALGFNWDAVSELFPPGFLDAMFAGYQRLLATLAGEDDQAWHEVRMLPLPAEELATRRKVNAKQGPLPRRMLHELFNEQAARTPDAPAVLTTERTISYGELAGLAGHLGSELHARGARPNSLVAVVMEKGWEQVVAVLGILRAGAAFLPIDAGVPARRLEHLLDRGEVGLVVTQPWLVEELNWPETVEVLALPVAAPETAVPHLDVCQRLEDLAYVIFTSGSTGQPKGVAIDHRGAVNTIEDINRCFSVGPEDRVLALSALNFDLSVYDIFGLLAAGGAVVFPDRDRRSDPGHWLDLLESHAVTLWNSVPALMELCAEEATRSGRDLPTALRLVLLSGDWIPVSLPDQIRAAGDEVEVVSLGGATECSIWSILYPIAEVDPQWKSIPYGRPMKNQTFHVLDGLLRPRPVWVPGELYIGGVGVALGYWRDEEKTAVSFITHPETGERLYRTGDLGRYLPDGTIEFLGREDFQVKIQGHRIELGEIEHELGAFPGVRSTVVAAVGQTLQTRRLVGYVVPEEGTELEPSMLVTFLEDRLPSYMVPSTFVVIEALPLTANGKVDRKALPAPSDGIDTEVRVAPRTLIEERVAGMWQELLGVEVGIHDTFFELGGNSLVAIQLISRLRESFGVEVPLRTIFESATVESLAQVVVGESSSTDVEGASELPMIVPAAADRHEPFPLNEVQQAYWLGRGGDFELGNVAAHGYVEIEFVDLDLDRFTSAWRRLIARHDMLRAVFSTDGRQKILAEVPEFEIEVDDLRGLAVAESEEQLMGLRERLSHQILVTEQWPLFEIRACRLDDAKTRIHFSFDLLISDAWSSQILFQEMIRFYQDPQLELSGFSLSFRDYVLAEIAQRDSAPYRRAWAFWQEQLLDLPAAPDLPLVKSLDALEQPHFVRRGLRLEAPSWLALKDQASESGLTPSGLVLAAFAEVLGQWSKSSRFTLNVTTFNRHPWHPEVNEIVGDFTSLTLLAVEKTTAGDFSRRARYLQERLWAGLEHSAVGGVQLLRELARIQGRRPGALMPVVFTSRLFGGEQDSGASVRLPGEVVYAVSQTPQVWLDVQVAEEDGELVCTWDAVEELLPAGVLDNMFAAFRRLFADLAQKETWNARYPVELPADELTERLAANATAGAPPSTTLHGLFERQVASRRDAPAVVAPERSLSYGELDVRSAALAASLRTAGALPNTLVGVVMEKGWEQVVATLGILRSGAAYLPIDAGVPQQRLEHLLERGEAAVVVTQPWLAGELSWPEGVQVLTVEEEVPAAPSGSLDPVSGPEDLAYVIFTSGSTGQPKGVAIDHRGAVNTIEDVNSRFSVGPDDRVLALSSLNFDLSVYDIFGLLGAGGTVVFPARDRRQDPAHWLDLVLDEGVTVWNSVPALMELCTEEATRSGRGLGTSLRLVLMSGDWIPVTLPDQIRAHLPDVELVSQGGATEASIWSILYPIGEVDRSWASIPYGRPMRNQTFHVLDGALRARPVWVPGELYIGGQGVALGYWRDTERTAASFVVHPESGERLYRTGDLGRYLPDGTIEFLGREDFQVKVGGHRIELGEIESHLLEHEQVRSVVVTVVGQSQRTRRLVGYLVPEDRIEFDEAAVRAFLEQRLPRYMVPSTLVVIEALPLTANGKVDRKALPAPEVSSEDPAVSFVAPRTPLEEQVASMWRELLGVESVGARDTLFDLGGNSLVAIQLVSRLRDSFGVEVTLRSVFETATVESLAALLAQQRAEETEGARDRAGLPVLVPAPEARHEPFPLNEVQQAYWLGRSGEFELGNVAAHAYFEIDFEGLDLERFTLAWRRLIERHDMMRAVFLDDGRQRVLADVPAYEIAIEDLRKASSEAAEEILEAVRQQLSHQVLPTDTWPLFELRASLLDRERIRLHFSFDLLIADAWSSQILFLELNRFYAEPDAALPELNVTFRDYVLSEIALQESTGYERCRAYWRERLSELPPAPELPLIKEASTLEQPHFQRRDLRLERETWDAVRAHCSAAGLTPSGLVLAAFAEVLGLWSKGPRFTVNVTTFNRQPLHPQVNEVVGDFTSLTLLAVEDVWQDSTFALRARRLQEQLWEDLDHNQVSGVWVLRELASRQRRQPGALMPVVFTSRLFRDVRSDAAATEMSLKGEVHFGVSQTPQVWLDHQVSEDEGALVCTWDVIEEMFPEGLCDAMFVAFHRLLENLARKDAWEERFPVALPADELTERLAANATAGAPPSTTLHGLFERQVASRRDAPAVVAAERSLSYGELDVRSAALAASLRTAGALPNTLVGVVMEKGWEQVVATLGILRSGAAYLPIDAGVPQQRLEHLLERGEAAVVVTQPWLAGELSWPEGVQVLTVDEEVPAAPSGSLDPVSAPEDLAYVIFTSGSTGQPKGVAIDHRGAVNTIEDVNSRFSVGPDDRVLALSSLNFDLSVYDIFGLLGAGGTVVFPARDRRQDPAHWLDLVLDEGVTVWNSVPALMELCTEEATRSGRGLGTSLRLVLMSGDWIPVTLPDQIRAHLPGVELVSQGGATEASIWSILYPIGEVDSSWASIPYGRPMRNQTFHVLDGALRARPVWVPGELYIGGQGVALGYWRDEERTAASFVVHPESGERLYRTGDLGRYLPDGTIEFLGREDFQVKVGGHRIELGEIESHLLEHEQVRSAVVTVVGQTRQTRRLAGYVVPDSSAEFDPTALEAFLAERLPSYMVPSTFLELGALPLTANGKLDRQALPALSDAPADSEGGYVAPRTLLEEQIAGMWQELLGVERVGIRDQLFDLGGNSLVAIQLVSRLRESFGVEVALRAVFELATVESLAALVARKRAEEVDGVGEGAELSLIVPSPETRFETFPLNEVQQAYWLGRSADFELGNVAAHAYFEVEFSGLDLDRFAAAWRLLIARHDMMRVVFQNDGRQRVLAESEVPAYTIPLEDLRKATTGEAERTLAAIRERMSHQVLSTDEWPLFELLACRLDDERIRIHFSFDLLIADAWSSQILFLELGQLYSDLEHALPELKLTFRDYVLAEIALRESPAAERSRSYWRERLQALPPAPELPLIKDPATLEQPRFRRHGLRLERHAWDGLKARSAQAGLTPSGLLLAAFAEVLGLWSKSPRFTLNVTTFNRQPLHPQVNEVIGDFTSLSLLAVEDEWQANTFALRARRLQEQLWEDLDHNQISGVWVLRELASLQGRRPGALMPVVFTSRLFKDTRFEIRAEDLGLQGEAVFGVSQTPQVWLDHQVSEEDGELVCTWDAIEELFPAGLFDTMFGTFRSLLECLTVESNWEERFPVALPADELSARLAANATAGAPPSTTLHGLFERQVASRRDAPAVVAAERSLSYGELDVRSAALAASLRTAGALPNTLVGVVMEKGWEQVVATLGILRSGAAYLPIDAGVPQQRLEHLLERGEAAVVVTQPWLAGELSWPEGVQVLTVEAEVPAAPSGSLDPVSGLEDLAYVIFTSGSTGQPKGVAIDHRGAVNTIEDVNSRFSVGPDDRVLALSSLNFDLSVYDIFGLLGAGGTVVFPARDRRQDPAHWLDLVLDEGVTVWNSVPALMELCAEEATRSGRGLGTSLRLVLMSGDWIPVTLPDQIRAHLPGVELVSQGGATEASIWSILYPIDEVDSSWASIPYGRPMRNQTFHVLDGALRARPVWVPGELYIGGQGVALGYWRDAERTAASFVVHPESGERLYRTGDLGRYLPDGTIEFLGREDFQVKVGGHRIELGEIESHLLEHEQVRSAVVTVVGQTRQARRLVGYVVPEAAGLVETDMTSVELAGAESAQSVVDNPLARLEFKLSRHGLRRCDEASEALAFETPVLVEEALRPFAERRSVRRFLDEAVPLDDFSALLAALRSVQPGEQPLPKYRYPSAGDLYPVQTYVYVKPESIEALPGGLYYYHPCDHRLLLLDGLTLSASIHGPVNQPIFASSAFSIFLVAKLDAIGPLYPETARDFCLLEAGYMGQLLMTVAPSRRLGLCPVGGLDFGRIREHFHIDDDHQLVHTLLGGRSADRAGLTSLETLQPEVAAEGPAPPPPLSGAAAAEEPPVVARPARYPSAEVVVDPIARLEFKLSRHGLRSDNAETAVDLATGSATEDQLRPFAERRSFRSFLSEPVPAGDLGRLLGCLRSVQPDGLPLPKYRYPSAGDLYPIRTYVAVKPQAVDGVEGGLYYYHPVEHRLQLLSRESLDASLHGPVNQPIFASSACSIFLVAKLGAIAPLYGSQARDFSLLEAGYMGQLLMTVGPSSRLGLCPVGGLSFEAVRPHLGLAEDEVLVHTLLVGRIRDLASLSVAEILAEGAPPPALEQATQAPIQAVAVPQVAPVFDAEAVLGFLRERLPEYMVPSTLMTLEALPLTPNGKVDRKALPEPETTGAVFESMSRTAPRTPVEEILGAIVSELLAGQPVGVRDSLFDLGVNSLVAIQLLSRVRDCFDVEIDLRSLFEGPTVAELAVRIEVAEGDTASAMPPVEALPRDEPLPVSFAQQRLWFLDQLNPGSSLYNVPAAFRLEGTLDVDILEQALNAVVARHESFRTVFVSIDGEPLQRILPSQVLCLERFDLRGLAEEEREREQARTIAPYAVEPFDLTTGPLLRIATLHIADEEHIVVFSAHHIISDGWSRGIFVRELAAFFEAFTRGEELELPPLRLQYADFASWQRQWLSGEVLDQQLSYWRRALGGELPQLELPVDHPSPSTRTGRGGRHRFMLAPELESRLRSLASARGATLFMVLLAGWKILLYRSTGQTEIVLGTETASRNRAEFENVVGFFVNILLMRTDLSGRPTYLELLERVKKATLGAFAHQDLPFDRLVEDLQPERSAAGTPMVRMMFVLQNTPAPAPTLGDLKASPVEIDNGLARFDLLLEMDETAGELHGVLSYNQDLFETTTIERLAAGYARLLESIVASPEASIDELELMAEHEQRGQVMKRQEVEAAEAGKLKGRRRRRAATTGGTASLVKTRYLEPETTLPLVIEPRVKGLDPIEWVGKNTDRLNRELNTHGAILFRGFGIESTEGFESFARAITPTLFGEYGDLPNASLGGKVYTSTPYPEDLMILYHNESSQMDMWPLKQWFYCVLPAQQGGETPIVDCRRVYAGLDPALRQKFVDKGVMYVRNFIDGFDVPWQDFFQTDDRDEVERQCREKAMEFEWLGDNGLCTRKICPAVAKHPRTGDMIFFNQIQAHHVSCLPGKIYESMRDLFSDEEMPRNAYFGDGTPITAKEMEQVIAVYRELEVTYAWQRGDILMVDNMLTAHARNPFKGPRKLAVVMGEMISIDEVEHGAATVE